MVGKALNNSFSRENWRIKSKGISGLIPGVSTDRAILQTMKGERIM
jgi:hypothetical protein